MTSLLHCPAHLRQLGADRTIQHCVSDVVKLRRLGIHDYDARASGPGDRHYVCYREDSEARSHCEQKISLLRGLRNGQDAEGLQFWAQKLKSINDTIKSKLSMEFAYLDKQGLGKDSPEMEALMGLLHVWGNSFPSLTIDLLAANRLELSSEKRPRYITLLENGLSNLAITHQRLISLPVDGEPGEGISYFRISTHMEPGLVDEKV